MTTSTRTHLLITITSLWVWLCDVMIEVEPWWSPTSYTTRSRTSPTLSKPWWCSPWWCSWWSRTFICNHGRRQWRYLSVVSPLAFVSKLTLTWHSRSPIVLLCGVSLWGWEVICAPINYSFTESQILIAFFIIGRVRKSHDGWSCHDTWHLEARYILVLGLLDLNWLSLLEANTRITWTTFTWHVRQVWRPLLDFWSENFSKIPWWILLWSTYHPEFRQDHTLDLVKSRTSLRFLPTLHNHTEDHWRRTFEHQGRSSLVMFIMNR